jgi:hypothetical protein
MKRLLRDKQPKNMFTDMDQVFVIPNSEYPSEARDQIVRFCIDLNIKISTYNAGNTGRCLLDGDEGFKEREEAIGLAKKDVIETCAEIMDVVKSLAFSVGEPPELGEAHARLDQANGGYTCNLAEM